MARYLRFQLILTGLILAALGSPVRAEDLPPPHPPPPGEERPDPDRGRRGRRDGEGDRFRKNLDRWKKMSPEDRKAMRQLHDRRREAMKRDIQQAIEKSGLKLDDERKEQFIKRYREERRQLEEQIRREMEVLRNKRLETIVEKLREEFSEKTSSPAETPSAAPASGPAAEASAP